MKAGAGKSEIILTDEYLEIENFTIIHRALNARAVAMEDDEGKTFVCLSLEVTSLPDEETAFLQKEVAKRLNLKDACIWVCVTHTFSAPHLLPDAVLADADKIREKGLYREALGRAAMEAAEKALASLEPAEVCFETGLCDANRNRDVELQDGWWVGEGGLGLSDHTVSVICLKRMDKTPLAVLFHYGVQSSVLDGSELSAGGRAVTPDLAGIASDYIEKTYKEDGAVALFLLGAAGDQCPSEKTVNETFVQGQRVRRDLQEEGFGICERLGEKLGSTVCDVVEKIRQKDSGQSTGCKEEGTENAAGTARLEDSGRIICGKVSFRVPGKEMERDLKKLHPVKTAEYISAQDKETEAEAVCIGGIALLGVKPELNCCSGLAISAASPFRETLTCTMVNGAAKYMADQKSYDRFTYEAMNSPFGKGAAEILTRQSAALLESLKKTV